MGRAEPHRWEGVTSARGRSRLSRRHVDTAEHRNLGCAATVSPSTTGGERMRGVGMESHIGASRSATGSTPVPPTQPVQPLTPNSKRRPVMAHVPAAGPAAGVPYHPFVLFNPGMLSEKYSTCLLTRLYRSAYLPDMGARHTPHTQTCREATCFATRRDWYAELPALHAMLATWPRPKYGTALEQRKSNMVTPALTSRRSHLYLPVILSAPVLQAEALLGRWTAKFPDREMHSIRDKIKKAFCYMYLPVKIT
jgi:hypothetical protein